MQSEDSFEPADGAAIAEHMRALTTARQATAAPGLNKNRIEGR